MLIPVTDGTSKWEFQGRGGLRDAVRNEGVMATNVWDGDIVVLVRTVGDNCGDGSPDAYVPVVVGLATGGVAVAMGKSHESTSSLMFTQASHSRVAHIVSGGPHVSQNDLPSMFVYFPASHNPQADNPGTDANLPAGHSSHASAFASSEKSPALQASHFVPLMCDPAEHD